MARSIAQHRAKSRQWHADNREYVKAKNAAHMRERGALIDSYKDVPCADCGQKFPPYCMDFHHRDPALKRKEVRLLAKHKLSVLLEEIAKCDVLCAICHRIRHHEGGDALSARMSSNA